MKKVFYIFVLLIIGINVSLYSQNSQTDFMKNRFTIGTYNFVMLPGLRTATHLQNYNDLQFNANLSFTYRGDGHTDWNLIDGYNLIPPFPYLPTYISTLNDLYAIQSSYNKQKVYFERAKIIRGALGQRSTYQVEDNSLMISKFPGYGYNYSDYNLAYNNIDDNTQTPPVRVKYCQTGRDTPNQYIAQGLYENKEQINYVFNDNSGKTDMQFFWSDKKDSDYFWVVKPRMRININDYNDPNKQEQPVVRIDVKNYSGDLIYSYDIKVSEFVDKNKSYHGEYIETFYTFPQTGGYLPKLKVFAYELTNGAPIKGTNQQAQPLSSLVDYSVYWYGNVDVWVDYVRLDDEWAHFLFTDPLDEALLNREKFHTKIAQEITALNPILNEENGLGYFYLDEYPYNSYPCIAEVNRIIKSLCPNTTHTGLVAMDAEYALVGPDALRNPPFDGSFYDTLYSSGAVTDVLINESYPFENHNVNNLGDRTHFISIPTTLPLPAGSGSYPQNGWANHVKNMYKQATSDENYNFEINKNMELNDDFYFLGIYRKGADLIKKARLKGKDILFSISIQNHVFEQKLGDGWTDEYGLRDVTNEEVRLQTYLGLIYGAKQIMDYSYNSDAPKVKADGTYYDYGLVKEDSSKRLTNYYGQPKWDSLCSLNAKLRQIGEIMYPTDHLLDKHLILDDSRTINTVFQNYHTEYKCGLPFKYINDIKSIYPNNQRIFLDNNTDEATRRYWEAGAFVPPAANVSEKYSKYFIMLNKRCTPPKENVSYGDVRLLKMKFTPSELEGFNNWVITEPLTNTVITTINKNSGDYYSLGEFQPGEGKLFKIAPVMQEGGTFVCEEQVINTSFVCKAPVHTGGNNLSLLTQNSGQMEISFKQGAQIIGESGSNILIWGSNNHVILKGALSNKWSGIVANDVSDFNMERVDISDISSGWSISVYNSPTTKINDCNLNLDENVRAINVNSTSISNSILVLYNNSINVKNNSYTMFLGSAAGTSSDLFFYNNKITSTPSSQLGVLLSNINSVDISDNRIIGFKTGLKLMGSTLDLASNTISNTGDGTIGIQGVSLSTINMGLIGTSYMGHDNIIYSHGNNCKNVSLDNSIFQMDYGNNDLKVDIGTESYNMFGNGNFVVSDDAPQKYIEIKENCFNGEGNNVIQYLTDPNGYLFSVHEFPHNCSQQQDMIADFVVPLTENRVDTVYKTTNAALQNSSASKTLYRNLYLNFIKKNYDSTIAIGTNLLTNYPDSISTNDVISKLYFSTIKIDTVGPKMAGLKTFYEQLILNNSQNVLLVKSANYYIQKCKVQLEQYTSALDGFQDIMVQNPYSYEGVLASWDYAATLLLTNSSGGFSNSEITDANVENEYLSDTLRINKLLRNDIYDKKVFTTDDRKQLIQSIGNVLKDDRKKQLEKVKILEEKLGKSDEKSKDKIKQDIFEAKNINSVVKVKRPKDGNDYLAIVNNDIEKLHPKKESTGIDNNNLIPKTYALYQNYPNPFNPTTKIAYDIPRDAKVKLVIYDILGREMKTLVNNEFKTAGKYITEFNGSNLASGIYFARILVNEGKDFMAVKKMVMVK